MLASIFCLGLLLLFPICFDEHVEFALFVHETFLGDIALRVELWHRILCEDC